MNISRRETIRREVETEVLPETDIAVCGGGTAGAAALCVQKKVIPGNLDMALLQRKLEENGVFL